MSDSAGRHLWRAMPAAVLINLCVGSLYAWSIFVGPLAAELGEAKAALSTVFALATASFAFSIALLPKYFFLFRAPSLAVIACLFAAAGLGVAAIGQNLWAVRIGYGLLFGVANGIAYALSLQVANDTLPERRGLATGIAVASYALGAVVFAPLFQSGVDLLGVWSTFGAMALWLFFSGGVLWVLLRPVEGSFRSALEGDDADGNGVGRSVFWILWASFFFGSATGLMFLGHAAGLVAAYGGTSAAVAAGTALIAACNCAGRLSSGWLSDHFPIRLILSSGAGIGAAALASFALVPSLATAFLCLLGVGLCYGLLAAGFASAVAYLYGTRRVGVVFGRLMTAWGTAGLMSPVVAGYVLDRTDSYRAAAILAGAFAIATALVSLTIPAKPQRRSLQATD